MFKDNKLDNLSKASFTAFNLANGLNAPQGSLIYNLSRNISLQGKKEVWACNPVSAVL